MQCNNNNNDCHGTLQNIFDENLYAVLEVYVGKWEEKNPTLNKKRKKEQFVTQKPNQQQNGLSYFGVSLAHQTSFTKAQHSKPIKKPSKLNNFQEGPGRSNSLRVLQSVEVHVEMSIRCVSLHMGFFIHICRQRLCNQIYLSKEHTLENNAEIFQRRDIMKRVSRNSRTQSTCWETGNNN